MMRGVVIFGALVGAGWYAYRKVLGSGTGLVPADGSTGTRDRPAAAGSITERLTQSVSQMATVARQAATTAVNKAREVAPMGGGAAADRADPESEVDGTPREARAAAMAAMPAMQQPAPFPDV